MFGSCALVQTTDGWFQVPSCDGLTFIEVGADPQQGVRSLGEPADGANHMEMKLARPRRGGNRPESDIPLNVYPRSWTAIRRF